MNRRQSVVTLASLASVCGSGSALAQTVYRAVGSIVSVRPQGTALILRSGTRSVAKVGDLLFDSDVLELAEEGLLRYRVYGELRALNQAGQRVEIRALPIDPPGAEDEAFFEQLGGLLRRPPLAIQDYSDQRAEPKINYRIQPSTLAPLGQHFVEDGTKQVPLIWQGGPATLTYQASIGRPQCRGCGGKAMAVISVPEGSRWMRVQMEHHALEWHIDFVGRPELQSRSGKTIYGDTNASRTRWAFETLRAQPPRFDPIRVAALCLLQQDAERTDIHNTCAREIWWDARNGELAKFVGHVR